MNKRGVEFSFNWLFSILIGIVVIALAIYGASKFIVTQRQTIDTESAQQLEYILNPLETSIESFASPRDVIFPTLSRIIFTCDDTPLKGSSILRVQSSSEVGGKWVDAGNPNKVREKYIFAQKIIEGKTFHSLVVPFNFPYKVGQLIMMWSKNYCFVDPPRQIGDVFSGNITKGGDIVTALSGCALDSVKVCFGSGEDKCDVIVDLENGRVKKNGKSVFFVGNLLYPAIFSDNEVYECNLRRLNEKRVALANLYNEKSMLVGKDDGCSSGLQAPLYQYSSVQYNNSRDLESVYKVAKELEIANNPIRCSLWKEEME